MSSLPSVTFSELARLGYERQFLWLHVIHRKSEQGGTSWNSIGISFLRSHSLVRFCRLHRLGRTAEASACITTADVTPCRVIEDMGSVAQVRTSCGIS